MSRADRGLRWRIIAVAGLLCWALASCTRGIDLDPAPQGSSVGTAAEPGRSEGGSEAMAAGVLLSSGRNVEGQLGRDADEQAMTLATVSAPAGASPLSDAVAVAAGAQHSVAVRTDGSVLAWGANDKGQLGNGTSEPAVVPTPVSAADDSEGDLTDVVAVSADSDFTMALRRDGSVVTWGRGDAGQRGNGGLEAPLTPTVVLDSDGEPLGDVVDIAADGRTALALLEDGTVVAWGSNDYGQLGDGSTIQRLFPTPVRGIAGSDRLTGVRAIAVGGQHGAALLADGRVATWGRNDRGQLGSGTTSDRLLPGLVSGPQAIGSLQRVVQLEAAEKFTSVLLDDGTVLGWGANDGGQLGDGTAKQRLNPVPVLDPEGEEPLSGVWRIGAGEAYGAAILEDRTLLTWGSGGSGQLASGEATSQTLPRPTMADSRVGDVIALGTGGRHLLVVAQE